MSTSNQDSDATIGHRKKFFGQRRQKVRRQASEAVPRLCSGLAELRRTPLLFYEVQLTLEFLFSDHCELFNVSRCQLDIVKIMSKDSERLSFRIGVCGSVISARFTSGGSNGTCRSAGEAPQLIMNFRTKISNDIVELFL